MFPSSGRESTIYLQIIKALYTYFVVVIELMFGNNFPNLFGGFSK
jgi:hypothetical protein